jgi:hypothetical protein
VTNNDDKESGSDDLHKGVGGFDAPPRTVEDSLFMDKSLTEDINIDSEASLDGQEQKEIEARRADLLGEDAESILTVSESVEGEEEEEVESSVTVEPEVTKKVANAITPKKEKPLNKNEDDKKGAPGSKKKIFIYCFVVILLLAIFTVWFAISSDAEKNRTAKERLDRITDAVSSIYSDANSNKINRDLDAALLLASNEDVDLIDIAKAAILIANSQGKTEGDAKEFAKLAVDIRKRINAGLSIDTVRTNKLIEISAAKADAINLDGVEKANFVIRSLVKDSTVDPETAIALLEKTNLLLNIPNDVKADFIAELSASAVDGMAERKYQQIASNIYLDDVYKTALEKFGSQSLAVQKAIGKTKSFSSNYDFKSDVFTNSLVVLESNSVDKRLILIQVLSSKIFEASKANGFKGRELFVSILEMINIEVLENKFEIEDSLSLLTKTLANVALLQGYSESEAIAYALVEASSYLNNKKITGAEKAKLFKLTGNELISSSVLTVEQKVILLNSLIGYAATLNEKDSSALSHALFAAANASKINNIAIPEIGKSIGSVGSALSDIGLVSGLEVRAVDNQLRAVEEAITQAMTVEESVRHVGDSASITNKGNYGALESMRLASIYFAADDAEAEMVYARVSSAFLAQKAGLTDIEIGMATEMAGGKIRAKIAGLSESEQNAVANRAGEKLAKSAGLSSDDARLSVEKIKTSFVSGKSEEEVVAIKARNLAIRNNKSLSEQNVIEEMAKLNYRAVKANAPATVSAIAHEVLIATNKAEALSLNPADKTTLINKAVDKSYKSMGLTKEQYNQIKPQVDSLYRLESKDPVVMNNPKDSIPSSVSNFEVKEMQKNILKLDIQLGQMERKIDTMQDFQAAIDELTVQVKALSGEQSSIKKNISDTLGKVSKGASSNIAWLTKEVKRQRSNFGWLSNRQCAIEARTKSFGYPKACEKIYAKIAKSSSTKKSNDFVDIPTMPVDSIFPKTTTDGEQEKNRESYLPKTIKGIKNAKKKTDTSKRVNVCENGNQNWVYKAIWDDGATLQRFDGTQLGIEFGSKVDGLGQVLFFQVAQQPKFIQFDKGIVCKG